ncbi:hypothetical protein HUJ05_002489 [Dendroctonus ponderosae]|nr:hypothetical protein HUJ05_002489 [Dendroctonus ponderosae]
MEYDKQINTLVSGYLKAHCKSAYKVFLKSQHVSPRHMSHWVAGQTLEVILKNYSRIQDIVHGCLEDTDYCKEKGVEGCSPYYLPEQLLYLLERDRPATPASTIATSPEPPQVESRPDGEEVSDNPSEVEATPTHLLPGNISSVSPQIWTELSSVYFSCSQIMTEKLLQKTDFHEKLAHNINSALNVPELTSLSEKCDNDIELENSIKKALNRTEADPIFHSLLEDLLGPVSNQLERAESPKATEPTPEQQPVSKEQIPNGNEQPNQVRQQEPVNVQTTGLYVIPSQPIAQAANQQYYIVNQPILIQQPNPQALLQQFQIPNQLPSVDTSQKSCGKFSEQDIMSMPTIFVNDRNELTYSDQQSTSTPTEVRNAKEYLNAFGAGNHSPILSKGRPRRKPPKPRAAMSDCVGTIQPKPSFVFEVLRAEVPVQTCTVGDVVDVEPVSKEVRNLAPICTPSPLVVASTKNPTPKSGSHVRSLQFPSPVRKTDIQLSVGKQKASKELFKGSGKKLSTPQRKKKWAWDASLRNNIMIPESPPRVKKPQKRSRPVKLDVSDTDGKTLEEALRSPPRLDHPEPKPQTPGLDIKKIVSPSVLCNTASKRNMEVDGAAAPKPPILSARKNINSLLETPAKKDKTPVGFSTTPLTPMLKANLKGIIVGDTFSIDTPDFPITPGMSLMDHPSNSAYCILKESEADKATQAGVLEEEKKSSVRKTDDSDGPFSPKVYGTKETLDAFNRNQTGKKNLELLDKDGVQWETKSDLSEDDQNKTVICNPPKAHSGRAARITRSATGKSLAALKCQMLQEERKENSEAQSKKEPQALSSDSEESGNVDRSRSKSKKKPARKKESDKKSKVPKPKKAPPSKARSRKSSKSPQAVPKPPVSGPDTSSAAEAKPQNNPECSYDADCSSGKGQLEGPENSEETAANSGKFEPFHLGSSILTPLALASGPVAPSLKEEVEEKRKRMIELDKRDVRKLSKTPSRRGSARYKPDVRHKRKGSVPMRLMSNGTEEQLFQAVSQDEFFEKIGSNLHRTNRSSHSEGGSEESNQSKKACKLSSTPSISAKSFCAVKIGNEAADEYQWDRCTVQLQSKEKLVVFDEATGPQRSREEYDWNLENKGFVVSIPLEGEREQPVKITITTARTLWEIPGLEMSSGGGSDPEDSKTSRKRKQRSDSCSSNGQAKKIKPALHPSFLNEQNIEMVLTKLHGPNYKTS